MKEDDEEAEGAEEEAAAEADDNAASFEDSHLHRLNDKVTEGGFFLFIRFPLFLSFFLFSFSYICSSFMVFFCFVPGEGRSILIYVYI